MATGEQKELGTDTDPEAAIAEGLPVALGLRDRAEAAFAAGDYLAVADLDRQIETVRAKQTGEARAAGEAAEIGELAHLAQIERRQLGLDRAAILLGSGATLLYLLGWIISLW